MDKNYKKQFPNFEFHPKSLKDKLKECLKELKTNTSNKQDTEKATLQSNHVLTQLKKTNGHVLKNKLKRC